MGLAKAGREAELDVALAALARACTGWRSSPAPFIPGKARKSSGNPSGSRGDRRDQRWATWRRPRWRGLATSKPEVLFPKPQTV